MNGVHSLFAPFLLLALVGCAAGPSSEQTRRLPDVDKSKIVLTTNSIDVPANIRAIVFYGSNRAGFEQGLLFVDAAGGVYDEVDLVPQDPPGTCLQREATARTLYLVGFVVLSGARKPVTVEVNAGDRRFYNVNIYDDSGTVVTETATVGIPTTPSAYCNPPFRPPSH